MTILGILKRFSGVSERLSNALKGSLVLRVFVSHAEVFSFVFRYFYVFCPVLKPSEAF